MIPPYPSSTTELLGGKGSFAGIRTRYCQESELRFNYMEPSIGIQWFFSFTKKGRLGTDEILVTGHGRIAVITASSELLMLLVLLCLYQQVEQLSLLSHNLGKVRRWWWQLLRTASLICSETLRGSACSSNHLKQRRCPSLTI
jgi:hypothetical protein